MHRSLVLLTLITTSAPPQAGRTPGEIVRHAVAAVEGDSAARVRARWTGAASATPPDRLAVLGLATLARLNYEHTVADSLYASLTTDSTAPDAVAVHALLARGHSARSRGIMADAVRFASSARRAAFAIRDTALAAEATILLASSRLRTTGPAAADSLFEVARGMPLDDRLAAMWHCGRAEMLALSFRAASADAAAGVVRATRAGDGRLRASCKHLLAADTARRGFIPEAVQLFGEAAQERRRLRDRSGLASSLQWRGAQNRTQGHLEQAYRDFQEAIAEGRASGNESARAWSFIGLQSMEAQLGDAVASSAYGDSATALFARQGDRYGQALALEGRALQSFFTQDLSRARDEWTRAIALYQGLGFGQGMYMIRIGLAHVAMATNDLDGVARELREARQVATQYGMTAFAHGLRYYDAWLAMRRGDLRGAERLLEQQLAQVRREAVANPGGAQPHWEYYDQMRLAEINARRGDLARAGAQAMQASEAIDRWRATLSRRELRLRALQMTEIFNDPDIGLSAVVARLVDANRLDTAFALVERLHSRELLDHLARAEGLREGAAPGASRDTPPAITQVLPTAEIAGTLPDSTALVQYLMGHNGAPSTVFVLTRGSLQAKTIALPDTLARDINRFVALLEARATPRELARVLARAVLDPAVALLPPEVTRLFVVPDGALHRLPFDALLLADDRFAVERFAIATLPSGSIAARVSRQPASTAAVRVLAVGDPETPRVTQQGAAGVPTAGARAAVTALHDLPPLRASRAEARSVAGYGNGSVALLGAAASESRLKRMPLADYRVLHFATHARIDEATLSGTALALAGGDGEDGLLGPGELSAFSLEADLVTLSACRSGGGAVVRGEGIVGLAAPLIGAGARAIALTRWPIGDASTPRFIDDFYAAIAAGAPAGDAMRTAKLAALRRGAPPAEWAAFTVVGDPMVRIPLGKPARRIAWTWIAAAAILVGVLGWLVTRRSAPRAEGMSAES